MTSAERILAAYAESEPWKAEHDSVMGCYNAEDLIVLGDLTFRLLADVDSAWQERVASGALPFAESDDIRIGELYRAWVEITELKLTTIMPLIGEGYEIKGLEELRAQLAEARAILESRSLEAEMRPVEDLLPLAKGNPRPEQYSQ